MASANVIEQADPNIWLTMVEIAQIIGWNVHRIALVLEQNGLTMTGEIGRFIPTEQTIDLGYALWLTSDRRSWGDRSCIRWHFQKIIETVTGQAPPGVIIWVPTACLSWCGMHLRPDIVEQLTQEYRIIQFSPKLDHYIKVYFTAKTDAAITKLHS